MQMGWSIEEVDSISSPCEQIRVSEADLVTKLESQKKPQCQIRDLSEFYLSSALAPSSLRVWDGRKLLPL